MYFLLRPNAITLIAQASDRRLDFLTPALVHFHDAIWQSNFICLVGFSFCHISVQ